MAQNTITKAIVHLLQTTPIEKITIEDASKEVGISIEQFKKDYVDVPTLITTLLEREAMRVTNINEGKNRDDLIEMLLKSRKFMLSTKKEIYNIYFSSYRYIVEKYFTTLCFNIIYFYITHRCQGTQITFMQQKKWIDFYSAAAYGIIIRWISKGMETNHEKRLIRLTDLVEKEIENEIDRIKEMEAM